MKRNSIYLLVLAVFFGIVYVIIFDSKLDLNGDNCNYLSLAKAMSNGLGYSIVTPSGVTPASHYPPGYSAFLSIFMFLGINNLVFFKVLNGIFLFLSLAGLFYLASNIKNNRILGFVAVILATLSPEVLSFSCSVMSEMLFLFASVVCFFALYKYSQRPAKTKRFWASPWFYVAIVATAYAYYLRTVGAALVLGLIIFYIFRKEWWQAFASLGGFVLLNLPWSIRNSIYGIESRYLGTVMVVNPWRPEEGNISSVGEFVHKMLVNFDDTVIKGFKELLFPFITINSEVHSNAFQIAMGLIVLAVVFYGAWNLKPLRWALMAYLLGQISLFMLWHGGNGSRYVVPVAPIIAVCFYVGLYSLIALLLKKQTKFISYIPYTFLLIGLLSFPAIKAQGEVAKMPFLPAYQNYFDMAKEMNRQLPRNTVCCCRKPELFMYFAPDIYAVIYVYSTDPKQIIKDFVDKKVEYVILEQLGYGSTGRYLYPAIMANQELFSVVWQLPDPDTYLLKFERQKAIEKLNAK
ncbi:MAG: hypothetical protein QM751_00635 [Paludibacteraceae bacterium]